MTYRELNDLFFKTWADKHGIIRGKPVMLIYRMNHAAGAEGLDCCGRVPSCCRAKKSWPNADERGRRK